MLLRYELGTGSMKMQNGLIILFLFIITCNACVNVSKPVCKSSKKNYCYCKNSTLFCCKLTSKSFLKDRHNCTEPKSSVTEIHIYNATIENFDFEFYGWNKLQSFSMIDGKIKRFNADFNNSNVTCMNISGNGIVVIGTETFTRLQDLKTLDVSRNNLTKIPHIPLNEKEEFHIDISNNKIKCKDIIDLLRYDNVSTKLNFKNIESTSCLTERSFHWFNSTDDMPLSEIHKLTKLDEACPSGMNYNCTCGPLWTDYLSINIAVKLGVNCSNRQLTELPPLPPNTISLDVSNNKITNLDLMSSNKNYSELREFIADNNQIESIAVLEGSLFIDNFIILSLRNNKIKSIPTYILSNAFDRNNFYQKVVKFGRNRLNCDCGTASVKMWLLNNKNYIQDYDEVQCEKQFQRVIDIDPSKVCIHEKDWTDYIYFIIAGELFLLLLLVSKVSYDYWVFKSYGYLPWPASKMPKLPCDWCFES